MGLELLTFLGLALVVEGVLLVLFPGALARLMAEISILAPERLRRAGLLAAALGGAFLMVLAHALGDGGLGFEHLRAFLAGLT